MVDSLASSQVFGLSTWDQFLLEPLGLIIIYFSKLLTYSCALAEQAIHPLGSVNLYRKFVRDNSALPSIRGGEVGG